MLLKVRLFPHGEANLLLVQKSYNKNIKSYLSFFNLYIILYLECIAGSPLPSLMR